MADVDSGGGGGGRGKKGGSKTKKKSTKIDMTAMVDVAFLLLTFFVLTATMRDDATMSLTMPPKVDEDVPDDETKVKVVEEKILTIILNDDDVIKYFVGITEPEVKETNFDPKTGIRKVILTHLNKKPNRCIDYKRRGQTPPENCWDPIFLIKPRNESRYSNLVDLLDEMAITEAPKYAIDKFTDADSLVLLAAELGPDALAEPPE
ncbi:MAG: biopolymer transporter ExbD [Bacteroidota bacterium]